MDETRLSVAVTDFGDELDEVTRLLGLAPTRGWRVGDRLPGSKGPPARHELWALYSPLPASAPFEAHLDALLTILEGKLTGFREAAARFSVGLQCHSHFETCNPGFAIPPDLVRRAAALGLGFDFDLYVFPEFEPEDPSEAEPA